MNDERRLQRLSALVVMFDAVPNIRRGGVKSTEEQLDIAADVLATISVQYGALGASRYPKGDPRFEAERQRFLDALERDLVTLADEATTLEDVCAFMRKKIPAEHV